MSVCSLSVSGGFALALDCVQCVCVNQEVLGLLRHHRVEQGMLGKG